MQTQSLEVSCDDPDLPVEFAIEVPPLPLPHAGRYHFRLVAGGSVVGTVAVSVSAPGEEG